MKVIRRLSISRSRVICATLTSQMNAGWENPNCNDAARVLVPGHDDHITRKSYGCSLGCAIDRRDSALMAQEDPILHQLTRRPPAVPLLKSPAGTASDNG